MNHNMRQSGYLIFEHFVCLSLIFSHDFAFPFLRMFSIFCSCENSRLLYDWLLERLRWTESSPLIGYPCGQDGTILLARDHSLGPVRKVSLFHTINRLLTKFVLSRRLNIGTVGFCVCLIYGFQLRPGIRTWK